MSDQPTLNQVFADACNKAAEAMRRFAEVWRESEAAEIARQFGYAVPRNPKDSDRG